MRTRMLMSVSAALFAALGACLTFLPDDILAMVKRAPDDGAVLSLKMLGALYLGFAILDWSARGNLLGGIYSRPVVLGNFMYFTVATLTMTRALSIGSVVAVALAIHAVLLVWFSLVLFSGGPPRPPDQR